MLETISLTRSRLLGFWSATAKNSFQSNNSANRTQFQPSKGKVKPLAVFPLSSPCAARLSKTLFTEVQGRFRLAFPVPPAALPNGAGGAVFDRIGPGKNLFAADAAVFGGPLLHDLRTQLPVSGEYGGAEVFADQRGGNELGTGAEVAAVQRQAVSPVIIGAQAADDLSGPPELAVVHTVQLTHG